MAEEIILIENLDLLVAVVTGDLRHGDYDRVKELAGDYQSYVTGVGLDKMMRRFVARETLEAFEQRQAITEHIIPAVVGNITSVERKVPRSNGKTRVVAYENEKASKKAKELEKILSIYWGAFSLDDWMATRWIELNDVDPNTFVVIEWDEFDGDTEKANPYPYEVNASEAIMFEIVNNIIQYLIDMKGEKYTLYGKNQTLQAIQLDEEEADRISKFIDEDGVAVEIDGTWYFRKDEKTVFIIIVIAPHNLGFVPAFRVGYKRDEVTKGRTFISPYNDCVPYLKKTLKTNSELDLTMALHAFPQKFVTANKCTGEGCNEGRVYAEGTSTKCKACKGTGFNEVHSSTQDIIYVPMPKGPDEQLSLANMALYLTPEVALLEFQRAYVEYLTKECMQAVFNSDVFEKDVVTTTATEKKIDLDNVYDTLYPLAVMFGRAWKFQVETIAKVADMFDGLIATLTFSKDFKFKSKDDYIRDRKNALDAGAPDAVLRNIDDEIVKIDTAENPMEFLIYKTVQSFDPFSGKTDEEIATAMASNTVPFSVKVFYANMGWIFDEVAMQNKGFFMMDREKQSKILKEKTEEIVTQLEENQTQAAQFVPE